MIRSRIAYALRNKRGTDDVSSGTAGCEQAMNWYNQLTMSHPTSLAIPTPVKKKQSSQAKRKGIEEALALAGAWRDLDFEEILNALDHIRHDSKPTPPIKLDL